MERYHVIDILIDRPYIKRTVYLPVWLRHVTGVLFYPVLPMDDDIDSNPLGVAGLSLQNEKLDVVTDMRIYRKRPVFYEITGLFPDSGTIYLDRGYGAYDFFDCNDRILPNSFATFVYTNRRMIQLPEDRFNANFTLLQTLTGKLVEYQRRVFRVMFVNIDGEYVVITGSYQGRYVYYRIRKTELAKEIYRFYDPSDPNQSSANWPPFFQHANSSSDEPFVLKVILRHKNQSQK